MGPHYAPWSEELEPELGALKLSVLRRRALAAGIAADALEAADDDESPKQTIIGLLLAHAAEARARAEHAELDSSVVSAGAGSFSCPCLAERRQDAAATDEGGRGGDSALLREELQGLRLSELSKRVTAAGAEDSLDSLDSPKDTLIDLIIALLASRDVSIAPEPSPEPEPEPGPEEDRAESDPGLLAVAGGASRVEAVRAVKAGAVLGRTTTAKVRTVPIHCRRRVRASCRTFHCSVLVLRHCDRTLMWYRHFTSCVMWVRKSRRSVELQHCSSLSRTVDRSSLVAVVMMGLALACRQARRSHHRT